MSTFKPLYVYLQRPDTGQWLTVGKYSHDPSAAIGRFSYAPSYIDAGHPWSIDPINLPISAPGPFVSERYGGLHDALRDACPDSWGRMLIQREHGFTDLSPHHAYLLRAGNTDRWGALAVGTVRKPSVPELSVPPVSSLDELSLELLAMQERRAPVNKALRKRLMATPSMGGARPKATVHDGQDYWLVKPVLPSDTEDIPRLEHAIREWGQACGMRFAQTAYQQAGGDSPLSVMRSLRFDRPNGRRAMTLSAASLLQTQYPGGADTALWSYPLLARVLTLIGAPREDATELFCRMVFNAVVGNDDDHPRNHAVVYQHGERRWRLAPAFDVVPNPDFTPDYLAMALSQGDRKISRQNALADSAAFGFESQDEAVEVLDVLLARVEHHYESIRPLLGDRLDALMSDRLKKGLMRMSRQCEN